ncbi:MAG: Crp/Fnr family transcriptional regulator [Limnochordia bacterium]|jgi:CRP-like cAMP-binding protein
MLDSIPENIISTYLRDGNLRVVEHDKNKVLHLEGEECTKLELVLKGEILIEHISEGGDLLTVAAFSRGDVIGGNLLFSSNPYYPWTVATRLTSTVLEIPRDVVFQLCAQYPSFLASFLHHVSDNAFMLGDRIRLYAKKSLREKILDYLHRERQRQGTNTIQLNLTKKALAEKFGVQRTSLSRELAKMRDDGLILFDRNTIILL